MERCEAATIECVQECSSLDDTACISQCIRDEQQCSNGKLINNDSFVMTHRFYSIKILFQTVHVSTIVSRAALTAKIQSASAR